MRACVWVGWVLLVYLLSCLAPVSQRLCVVVFYFLFFFFSDFFVRNCDGLSVIRSFIHSSNIFIYSLSSLQLHGVQWNLDFMKYQGTGEIGSLYVRTVTSSHCSIYFKRSGARFSKVPVT